MLHSSAYILSFNPQSNPVRSAVICCMLRLGSHALHLWRPCPPFAGRTRWVPRRLGHLSRELTLGRYEQLTPPLGSGVLRSEREIRKKPHFSIQQVFPEAGAGLGTAEVNQRVLPWKFTVWPEGEGTQQGGGLEQVLSMLPFQNVPLACPPLSIAGSLCNHKPPAPGPVFLLQEPLLPLLFSMFLCAVVRAVV